MIERMSPEHELQKLLTEELPAADPAVFAETVRGLNVDMLLRSAERFPTPQYLLDADTLRSRVAFFMRTFRRCCGDCEFYFPFKCNDLPYLVKTVQQAGMHADVAGLFELQLALRLGFSRILFNGPGKSDEELKLAIRKRRQVSLIIDNRDEIERLKELIGRKPLSPRLRVGLRITAQSTGNQWSKFGFPLRGLKAAIDCVRADRSLSLQGLHFHCSWNRTPDNYCRNIELIGDFLRDELSAEERGELRFLDIGGGFYPEEQCLIHKGEDKGVLLDILVGQGFDRQALADAFRFDPAAFSIIPVEPLETFATAISRAFDRHIRSLSPAMTLYCEPGRFLAAHATTILLRVIAIKDSCIIVDGGINMLGDDKFFQYSFAPIVNVSHPSTRMNRDIICGPLCDPADVWGFSWYGERLQTGDVLAVLHQGAYTFSTAWRFIKPVPAYIAASNGELQAVRSTETFNDRYRGCLLS